jgi:cyclopropane fatty-acyl-phospholipid synthase-like methyltransferase
MAAKFNYTTTKWGWGRTGPPLPEKLAWDHFPWKAVYASWVLVPGAIVYELFGGVTAVSLVVFLALALLLALPILSAFLFVHSRVCDYGGPLDPKYVKFRDAAFEAQWRGKKIPVLILYEAYFAEKVDIEGDLLEALYHRRDFISFIFTVGHARFFLFKLIPELLAHTRKQDTEQVRDHYDRGNDFYNAFLGETMIYTSGIFMSEEDTLEEAQRNKLELVCNKIHLKKGERMLDIGCGWGTLVCHAAKEYGARVTGVTLAKEQTQFALDRIRKAGVEKAAEVLCMDYRDIPRTKYNKITCLEMAEHVGIRLFPTFLRQVYDMLEDDGIFFLQIAGLRRAWQYEDLQWGCFMGNYVFPGADASCPLGWVINQVEAAGFEVHSSETIGIHYSATIKRWYDNWVKNKAYILEHYGQRWYRTWLWFLAWAVISPEQGSATCYQIVMHKNTCAFDRKGTFLLERKQYKV